MWLDADWWLRVGGRRYILVLHYVNITPLQRKRRNMHLSGRSSVPLARPGIFCEWLAMDAEEDKTYIEQRLNTCGVLRSLSIASVVVRRVQHELWTSLTMIVYRAMR